MRLTRRTAYNHEDKTEYQIEFPPHKEIRKAILEMEWPPEGLSPTEVKDILVEVFGLSEEQKTAVTQGEVPIFYNVVQHNLGVLFEKRKLEREDGVYRPIGAVRPSSEKTIYNDKKFEAMLELAKFGAERIEGRRSTEFRIFISYTTLLVLALYQLIKPTQTAPTQTASIDLGLWEGIGLYLLVLLIHILYVMWQVGVAIAMHNDAYRRNVCLKEAEDILDLDLDYNDTEKTMVFVNYWKQFCHLEVIWEHWSRPLLVGIPTILFLIISDLSIRKFGGERETLLRILLWGVPILLVLVIPFITWGIKKYRKKKSNSDETDNSQNFRH